MPKVIASAPGKVTLFGEHAIVYGYPAIVTSIDRRVYVTSEPRSCGIVWRRGLGCCSGTCGEGSRV